jgi:hypothetical protein
VLALVEEDLCLGRQRLWEPLPDPTQALTYAKCKIHGKMANIEYSERAPNFPCARNVSQRPLSDAVHFGQAEFRDLRRSLLIRVNPESPEKSGYVSEAGSYVAKSDEKIPIHREVKALIKVSPNAFP